MNNLGKKQKIILGIIGSIVIATICYYVYSKDENIVEFNENIYTENIMDKQAVNTTDNNSDTNILVDISGAVNKEGIVELKIGDRISDAIEKAGGLKSDAYIKEINLAYKLEDAMKIYIPTIQEKEKEKESENIEVRNESKQTTTDSGIANIGAEYHTNNKNTKVNLNTATQTELETLPGIGPSTALKIINYRKEKGKFSNIEEIKEVNGIGEAKFNNIKNLITV